MAEKKAKTTRRKKTTNGEPAKSTGTKKKAGGRQKKATHSVTPEERWRMIAEAAYYLAEKRGFAGDSVNDWVEAEKAIDAAVGAP